MNVLYGLYKPDEGEILVDDKPVAFHDPGDAIRAGIGMVHQHFMLVPVFTVTENIMLGVESTRGPLGILDRTEARRRIVEVSERHGLHVDPDALVEDLPVGVRQRVEIIKTLYRKSNLLILDEPTAVLTPQEDRGAVRDHAVAAGRRHLDHLHHPQAQRGPGDRRPDHRAAARQGRGIRGSRRGDPAVTGRR